MAKRESDIFQLQLIDKGDLWRDAKIIHAVDTGRLPPEAMVEGAQIQKVGITALYAEPR